MNSDALARRIDHAILRPSLSLDAIYADLDSIQHLPLASVCVRPFSVRECAKRTSIPIGAVVGFPHGGEAAATKREEAVRAIGDGAIEIDMVVNASLALGGAWATVTDEIEGVCVACHEQRAILKVIFENAYLDDGTKIRLCQVCSAIGVDFVKTSTGFGMVNGVVGGATVADVRLMREHTDARIGVKASGGIRTLHDVEAMLAAGADRIGTAATLDILGEAELAGG